jgi:hypothetical protein
MGWFKGFARIQAPRDLLKKLRRDRKRMEAHPDDEDAAFDFFVTADSMLDWVHPDTPGKREGKTREAHRNRERILQIAYHIASGAKHFEATADQHKSVRGIDRELSGFDPSSFSTDAFNVESFAMSGLHVRLDDGSLEHVFSLADRLIEYWDRELPQ